MILGSHGLKGAVCVRSFTRTRQDMAAYPRWWLGVDTAQLNVHCVSRCWMQGKRLLALLDGVNHCTQAEVLQGMNIWIPKAEIETADDEYLWDDLMDCTVVNADTKQTLGTVHKLDNHGAQDLMFVRSSAESEQQGEWLLPFSHDVVLDVDVAHKRLTVHLIEGMDACFTPKS